jgi:hypothetical protein
MTAAGQELVAIGVHGERGFAQCAYRRHGGRALLARQSRGLPMQ